MVDRKERFKTKSNAPMLHCWPIGTIKVVIGRLSVKLEPEPYWWGLSPTDDEP